MTHDIFQFPEEKKSTIRLHIADCLDILDSHIETYDAIITDPPYLIALHAKEWDTGNISFSSDLWSRLYAALKPGGFIAAFGMPRLYHRLATAAEDAGFELYPFLVWQYDGGMPKPINLSELFDRDNVKEREIVGYRQGSGYTKANVVQGAQERTHTSFPVYARHVSPEAVRWRDWFYGVNTLKPTLEPILLAQKPISAKRMIDNVRQWGVGALNVGALKNGNWPTNILEHAKARKRDHQSDHPSVKPVPLLEDLCKLLCPPGGLILDPFAGTGTTGVAARNLGFDCVLIEQNPEMEAVIRRRAGIKPSELF